MPYCSLNLNHPIEKKEKTKSHLASCLGHSDYCTKNPGTIRRRTNVISSPFQLRELWTCQLHREKLKKKKPPQGNSYQSVILIEINIGDIKIMSLYKLIKP